MYPCQKKIMRLYFSESCFAKNSNRLYLRIVFRKKCFFFFFNSYSNRKLENNYIFFFIFADINYRSFYFYSFRVPFSFRFLSFLRDNIVLNSTERARTVFGTREIRSETVKFVRRLPTLHTRCRDRRKIRWN